MKITLYKMNKHENRVSENITGVSENITGVDTNVNGENKLYKEL